MIINFIEIQILTHFEVSDKIKTENAVAFRAVELIEFRAHLSIMLSHSTKYYPQGNALNQVIKICLGSSEMSFVTLK